jgi:hypothetical protein
VIARIPGWSWEPQGGGVTLLPSTGGAALRYRERLQPLRSAAAILRTKAEDPSFRVISCGPIERLVTHEGEFAALVDLRGEQLSPDGKGALVHRTIGWVFGDDWYSEVAGIAFRPDLFEPIAGMVRTVLRDEKLQLGTRRRRFVYTAPPGWYGYSRLPHYTTWFPPEFPRDATSITVYPAVPAPVGLEEDENFAAIPIGPPASADVIGELLGRTPVRFDRLTGNVWELEIRDERQRAMVRRAAILRDERYLYSLYLDAPFELVVAGRVIFDEMLATIEPLPGAAMRSAALSEEWL